MTAQAAPVDARQIVADTLTDIAVRIDTRQRLKDSLYDLLTGGGCAASLAQMRLTDWAGIALIGAADAAPEVTAALLEDLATASTRLERHRDTTGHDECCGGECDICSPLGSGYRRNRCDGCEIGPADLLWQAQRDLTDHLDHLHSLDDLLRAASDGERQPREHPVPCQVCHRPTWEVSADCGQHTTASAS